MCRGLAILGSTGSIGRSALAVVQAAGHGPDAPDAPLRVVALAAGRNLELLAQQTQRFRPRLVSVQRPEDLPRLGQLLRAAGVDPLPDTVAGDDGLLQVASHADAEVVLTAVVGAVGLRPTLAALGRPITVAIANKEPLAMAGQLCMEQARRHGATVVPVDSEHSAIFQCLRGQRPQDVRRILLTGSGGPFRQLQDLTRVTVEQALAHPRWSMGAKISVDSATLMNKGLELIEARWLFDLPAHKLQIMVHPQAVVHSMVEFVDGAVLAQLGPPDMRIPIAYALGFPGRMDAGVEALDLLAEPLSFEPPDPTRFPCLDLAYGALEAGGTAPAALNAANEVAVEAFLQRRLRYLDIAVVIRQVLDQHSAAPAVELEAIIAADLEARAAAQQVVTKLLVPV